MLCLGAGGSKWQETTLKYSFYSGIYNKAAIKMPNAKYLTVITHQRRGIANFWRGLLN